MVNAGTTIPTCKELDYITKTAAKIIGCDRIEYCAEDKHWHGYNGAFRVCLAADNVEELRLICALQPLVKTGVVGRWARNWGSHGQEN